MQVPIGNLMKVGQLRIQVVQISTNPSKRNFQKCQSLVLQIGSEKTIGIKEKANVKHIEYRVGLDMIWSRKPMNTRCELANNLHRCVQVPNLEIIG